MPELIERVLVMDERVEREILEIPEKVRARHVNPEGEFAFLTDLLVKERGKMMVVFPGAEERYRDDIIAIGAKNERIEEDDRFIVRRYERGGQRISVAVNEYHRDDTFLRWLEEMQFPARAFVMIEGKRAEVFVVPDPLERRERRAVDGNAIKDYLARTLPQGDYPIVGIAVNPGVRGYVKVIDGYFRKREGRVRAEIAVNPSSFSVQGLSNVLVSGKEPYRVPVEKAEIWVKEIRKRDVEEMKESILESYRFLKALYA